MVPGSWTIGLVNLVLPAFSPPPETIDGLRLSVLSGFWGFRGSLRPRLFVPRLTIEVLLIPTHASSRIDVRDEACPPAAGVARHETGDKGLFWKETLLTRESSERGSSGWAWKQFG